MKTATDIENRINQLIQEERTIAMNPYLSTRVMAAIEKQQDRKAGQHSLILKPVLAIASLVLVVAMGVMAGSAYPTRSDDGEAVLRNDAQAEHFAFYLQTEKEE
jgi:Na+/proline symporter